jgi:hypothetical protein
MKKIFWLGTTHQAVKKLIDTRKWIASKLAPKIYGDKIDNTHSINMSHEEALKLLM